MRVDLLIVATNQYIKFLPDLIESVNKHFMTDQKVIIHVFTDRRPEAAKLLNYQKNIFFHLVDHKPWPYATLNRFHFFKKFIKMITGDYVFYIDADTIIKEEITKEILSPVTIVRHCGFINGGGSWETRKESTSYVAPGYCTKYFGGGFWGFEKNNFQKVVHMATSMIDIDAENNIIPEWHDESVLNKILTMPDYEPTIILDPSYHWPENNPRIWNSWKQQYPCKILLLDKNHKEIRE